MPQVLNNSDEQREAEIGLRQGKAASVASQGMRAGGAMAQMGGRGGRIASKGAQTAGREMMRVGAGLSETGLGAVAGVPLMAVGGLTTAIGAGGEAVSRGAETAGRATKKTGGVSDAMGALRQAKNESKVSDKAIDFAKTKLPPQAQAVIKAMDMAGVDTNKWIKRLIIGNVIFITLFYLFIIMGGVYMSLSLWDWFKIWWSGVWG